MFTEPGSAREEAERLIAAALAAATLAANANPHWSTGSAECCVCPLCKVIAAVRDPDPQFVERLATGAGDLAAGLTSFLRNIAPPDRADDPWSEATRSQAAEDPVVRSTEGGPRRAPAADRAEQPADHAGRAGQPQRAAALDTPAAPRKPMAKKAAKKAVKRVPPPTDE